MKQAHENTFLVDEPDFAPIAAPDDAPGLHAEHLAFFAYPVSNTKELAMDFGMLEGECNVPIGRVTVDDVDFTFIRDTASRHLHTSHLGVAHRKNVWCDMER